MNTNLRPYLWYGLVGAVMFCGGYLAHVLIAPTPAPPGPFPPAPSSVISLPQNVTGEVGQPILLKAQTQGSLVKWHSHNGAKLVHADDGSTWVYSPTAGAFKVGAYTATGNKPSDIAWTTVTIGTPPDPGPTPPGPTPPGPTPGPVTNMRVLILYETAELSKLPAGQSAVLYNKSVRDLLNAKTAMGPDGKTHEWRMWDKDVDASKEAPVWAPLLARPRTSVPWVVISGDKGVAFEGPLPATVDDMLALIKKWGGN